MFKKTVILTFLLATALTIFYFLKSFNYFPSNFLTAGISSLFSEEKTEIIKEESNLTENNLIPEGVFSESQPLAENNNKKDEPLAVGEIQNKIDDTLEQIDILEAELTKLLEEQLPIGEEVENIKKEDEEEKIEEENLEEPEEKLEEEIEKLTGEEIGQEEIGQTVCFKIAGFLPNQNKIIINEVAWMGTLESLNNEWIELKNISNDTVNLAGWQLLDKEAKIKIIFSNQNVISPNGFLLLERTDDNSVSYINADLIYTGALNDTAEELYLFNENCDLEDEVLAVPDWPAGDKVDKRTIERKNNLEWQTSLNIGGTPKAQNSIGFVIVGGGGGGENIAPSEPVYCSQENLSEPVLSPVILNEIAWMGTLASYTNEWFEIKNISEDDVSLDGWQILDKASQIKIIFGENDLISANGFYLLERTDDNSVPDIPADKIYTGSLGDEEETLRIFDKNCNLIDEVSASPDWPAGEKTNKKTMERKNDLSWQTYFGQEENGIMGTPKKENSQSAIPEEVGDTTPPTVVFNPLFSPQTQLSFSLSWAAEDPIGNTTPSGIDGFYLIYAVTPSFDGVVLQYQKEGNWNDWLEEEEIETEENSVTILGKDGYEYSFKIKVKDRAGNESSAEISAKIALLKNPLITEVQIEGDSVNHDFIEIYNPNNADLDVSSYKLRKRTLAGSESSIRVFPIESIIRAKGYYLWASSEDENYPPLANADVYTKQTIAKNNSIALLAPDNTIISALSWGVSENPFVETSPFPENPNKNYSLSRIWIEETDDYKNIGDNSQDFHIANPTPKIINE